MNELKSPYPYFGGKSRCASLIWQRLGDCTNYVEPFFGSGAVLLLRPHWPFTSTRIETVNDLDGMISNVWRSLQADPDAVATWADWPVNECDLHARHIWLVRRKPELISKLMANPDYFDAQAAGLWLWGVACWIGSGFCSGNGAWTEVDGEFVKAEGQGVSRKRPHLGDAGRGTVKQSGDGLREWFTALQTRMERVRVCCGDWNRICGPSVTTKLGVTGVFLDPPYADTAKRCDDLYANDSLTVAHDVREWAVANGDDPKMRICLAGYEGEHAMPASWECVAWKASGGYASQGSAGAENSKRERLWFSPHCQRGRLL